jgi:hypothetical protein
VSVFLRVGAGSGTGGELAEIAYTILGSCALAQIDPWASRHAEFCLRSQDMPRKPFLEGGIATISRSFPMRMVSFFISAYLFDGFSVFS